MNKKLKEKMLKSITSKNAVKQAIINKGVDVGDDFSTYASAIDSIQSGGGGSVGDGKYHIRYLDIDGTILKEEYLNEGDSLTPPDNPSYDSDYLVFDSWNYDIENTVVDRNLDIGAIYNTIDGSTYLFCKFTTNIGLNPTLAISGSPTIDWGDGTVNTSTSHTYANEGSYIIKISGSFTFITNNSAYLLGSSNLNYSLQKVYLGNVTSTASHTFYYCRSLQNISIPNSVTSIGSCIFNSCNLLQSVSIPNSVITHDYYTFQNCYSLKIISIPILFNIIASYDFSSCYSLQSVSIPSSVTVIGSYAFRECYSLQSISIPNNVTSIDGYAFSNCHSLTNYFILCDQVPKLVYRDAFNYINKSCIMWVNDDIIEDLKVATNWSNYASYMKPLSECPQELLDEHGIERPEPLPEPSGYSVKITNGNGIYDLAIYDGDSTSGTYLGNSIGTYTISSGYMHIYAKSTYTGGVQYQGLSGGLSIENSTTTSITLKVTGDGSIDVYSPCLIEDTPITLADGQYKMIQDITYEDDLLVWDFDKCEFASAKPLWIMKERKAIEYNHLVFSDGSELNTVNQHRIFNVEKGMFTYPMTDDTPIGTTTFNDKGEYVTLVSKEVIEKEVNYYNIITDYHINLFAGSILTSCRLSNIYPIEDMKYIKDNRDIIDYEEFNDIPIEYYYGLRLGEQPVDINRDGAVSFGDTSVEDYVKRLIANKKE